MAGSRVVDPEFLVSPAGRLSRSAFGAALVVAGRAIGGRPGAVLAALGVVPIVNSALGFLAIGPFIGTDLRGRPRRRHLAA
jgi:predicted alpha/beta-hydrolase family hydrolase